MTACSAMAMVIEVYFLIVCTTSVSDLCLFDVQLWLRLRTAIRFGGDVTRGPEPAKWTTLVHFHVDLCLQPVYDAFLTMSRQLLVAPYVPLLAFSLSSIFVRSHCLPSLGLAHQLDTGFRSVNGESLSMVPLLTP